MSTSESNATAAPPPATSGAKSVVTWILVALTCLALGAAGGVRTWQARRIGETLESGRESPFPLASLPDKLGPWVSEGEARLDPVIARATGCTDHIVRQYVDDQTGTSLQVVILYGPAAEVSLHSPELCYPTAGFSRAYGPVDHAITAGGHGTVFRSLVFTKGEGGQTDREEIYFTWIRGRNWTPQLGDFKDFERLPGIFKVHVARRVIANENLDDEDSNPCQSFLKALIPEMEGRLEKPAAAAAVAAATQPGTSPLRETRPRARRSPDLPDARLERTNRPPNHLPTE